MTLNSNHPHIDRKDLKRPDSFMTAMTGFFDEVAKHPRALVGVAVAALAIGGIAVVLNQNTSKKSAAARDAIYQAELAVEKKLQALAAPSPAPSGKPATPPDETVLFKAMDVDQEFGDAVQKYKDAIAKYGGSAAGAEARLSLGSLYFRHGQADKAIPLFEDAAKGATGIKRAYAYMNLGYAYENAGKPAEALQAFEKGLNLGEPSLKGDLLLAQARCQEALNDKAKALATYEQIITQLPDTDYAKSARLFKTRIQ